MQPKAARNISIEALRLVAVAGIAVFHTFQWTFQATCVGLPEYAPLAAFPYSGVLGFINLLGCWANEVFFMISGYFLIASARVLGTVEQRGSRKCNGRRSAWARSLCPLRFIASWRSRGPRSSPPFPMLPSTRTTGTR